MSKTLKREKDIITVQALSLNSMLSIREVSAETVWPIRHQVMYPELNFELIKLESDAISTHLGLYKNEQLLSVVSLLVANEQLQFRKFATLEQHQGKGYGSMLLNYIIEYAQTRNLKRVWCNARLSASQFYKKFGFRPTPQTFFKDGHHFVIMELELE